MQWADMGGVSIGDRCVEREFSRGFGQQYQTDDSRNSPVTKGCSLKDLIRCAEHRKRSQCERHDEDRCQRRRHQIRSKHVHGGRFHRVGLDI